MILKRLLLLAVALGALLAPFGGAPGAQVFADDDEGILPRAGETLTLAEIRLQLLARTVPPEIINRSLARFPEDRLFTADEAQILIDSVESLLPSRLEAGEPERDEDGTPARGFRTPVFPPELDFRPSGEVPLFGQSIFRGVPEGFQPAEDIAVGADYILGAGDEMSIVLWGSIQRHWTPTVGRDGTIALPQVGLVSAAGLSLGEFRSTLRTRLASVYSGFNLSVTLKSLRSIQVSVLGDVRRPGTYTLSPLSTSFNALYYAGGPLESGSLRRVRVFRGDSLLATVDLYGLLLEGESRGDVRLGTDYRVFVPSVFGIATVWGDVRRPGRYEAKPGDTLADLLTYAGGFTATAYPTRAVLERVTGGSGYESREVDLSTDAASIAVRDGDVLTVYPVFHVEPKRFVHVSGEVQSPGSYALYPGMSVSDLIFRAGNTLESAYLLRGELSRQNPGEGDSVATSIFFDAASALDRPRGAEDPGLAPDDRVYVRRRPGWLPQSTVDVMGEVRFPGTYTLSRREERLSQVLERAGGLTPAAFPSAAGLFREKAGRIIVDFDRALRRPRGLEDVALSDGDSIFVPRYDETIQVVGAVSRPGALVYQPGKTAEYYLQRTGGLKENADKGRIHIVRVDGVVRKAGRSFWFDPEVPPGAVIEVEAKPQGPGVDWMAAIRDATAIVTGFATTIFIITQIK